jgi:hypothetical protein
MKKTIALFLSALLALAPFAWLSEDQYYTVSELRAQAPAEWTETFETKWRTIDIDAKIVLPDVDAIPVLKIARDYRTDALTGEETAGWEEAEISGGTLILSNGETKRPKKLNGKKLNSY